MSGRACAGLMILSALFPGCGDDGGDGDGGRLDGAMGDGSRNDVGPPRDAGEMCVTALPVDMVWVVDNSNSMAEEQASLAQNFPALIDVLTNPPDENGDGMPDYPPLTDLRVAVITTDMGVGDNAGVIGCTMGSGDDGLFIGTSRSIAMGCPGLTIGPPPWLDLTGSADPTTFTQQFACLAELGTDGCGYEQQLEASYRALIDHRAPGGPHDGFLRDNSVVAIVYVTDEDDCSTTDDGIYATTPAAMTMYGHPRTRCFTHADLMHPVSRYVTAFRNLALDRAGDVVVAAITGVPRDLVMDPTSIDYDALLADEDMQFRLDPADMTQLLPACAFGGAGNAVPARRIVELVSEFAQTGDGVVQSICQPDLRPAIEVIAQLIGSRLCPPPI